jgi:hypothetical protein
MVQLLHIISLHPAFLNLPPPRKQYQENCPSVRKNGERLSSNSENCRVPGGMVRHGDRILSTYFTTNLALFLLLSRMYKKTYRAFSEYNREFQLQRYARIIKYLQKTNTMKQKYVTIKRRKKICKVNRKGLLMIIDNIPQMTQKYHLEVKSTRD